ncbi:MAG: ATP-dependent Clp protease proteolytic subunit [Phycisphaerales bacterium]|jgi:membrane-bound serine protease (ClpP class)|nr:ATP-dependent Clp protease proteolytic subunit [Phycisphaerales bacterium]
MNQKTAGLWCGFCAALLLLGSLCAGSAVTTSQTTAASTPAVQIILSGPINDMQLDALVRRFDAARKLGAKAIILQIDTYGGAVTSGLEISHFLKSQTDLHTIAYVPQKAISAGAMIALACNELVMGPSATLGDAAPIALSPGGGMQTLGAAERAKAESPVLEDFRDSALRNGYEPLLAEAMVSVGVEVHWIENKQGLKRFVDGTTYQQLTAQGDWQPVPNVRNPIDGPESLLTVHSNLALQLGLAKQIVNSADQLAQQRNYNLLRTLEPSLGDRAIDWLGGDVVRLVLTIIFFMSLYTALHVPGHGAPEAFAAASLMILLGVPLLTGYAQWWEILAILIGLALLAFEVFVFPGHFVPGIVGLLLALGGFLMTFVPKEPDGMPGIFPAFGSTWSAMQRGLLVIAGAMAASLFLWFWLNRYLPKLPYFNRLIIQEPAGGLAQSGGSSTVESWPKIGASGEALTDLRPGGTAAFIDPATGDRRTIDVVSDSGFVPANSRLVVMELRGGYAVVRTV